MVQDTCSKLVEAATRQFAGKVFYGAIAYFTISEPTPIRMFGKQEYRSLEEAYPARLRVLIRTTLATLPSAPS